MQIVTFFGGLLILLRKVISWVAENGFLGACCNSAMRGDQGIVFLKTSCHKTGPGEGGGWTRRVCCLLYDYLYIRGPNRTLSGGMLPLGP